MTNLDELTKLVSSITTFLVVLVALLRVIIETRDILEKYKPVIKILIIFGILFIPIGIIIWGVLYVAAVNASRLTEPPVFLSLVAESTLAIFGYVIVWRKWIYPWLQHSLFVWHPGISQKSAGDKHKPGGKTSGGKPRSRRNRD